MTPRDDIAAALRDTLPRLGLDFLGLHVEFLAGRVDAALQVGVLAEMRAEIDRLRSHVVVLLGELSLADYEREDLREENARLREALRSAEYALAAESDLRGAEDLNYHVPVAPALDAVRVALSQQEKTDG